MKTFSSLLLAYGLGLGACGEAEITATQVTATVGPEVVLLNQCAQTSSLDPDYYAKQGQRLQGLTGANFVVQGARIGCQSVDGLNASSGNLVGTAKGRTLTSADFQGAALQFVDVNGVHGEVAVTKVESDPMDDSGGTAKSVTTFRVLSRTWPA